MIRSLVGCDTARNCDAPVVRGDPSEGSVVPDAQSASVVLWVTSAPFAGGVSRLGSTIFLVKFYEKYRTTNLVEIASFLKICLMSIGSVYLAL